MPDRQIRVRSATIEGPTRPLHRMRGSWLAVLENTAVQHVTCRDSLTSNVTYIRNDAKLCIDTREVCCVLLISRAAGKGMGVAQSLECKARHKFQTRSYCPTPRSHSHCSIH
eukprot:2825284-Amphidinium_carterae.1